jgi:hypothetical protein
MQGLKTWQNRHGLVWSVEILFSNLFELKLVSTYKTVSFAGKSVG